ncbi:MAG: ABC transporter substrate-binding protein [Stigonema ocellatum SAG 48.90 = DSM 106950]|nr:ABC transporter substrate-binding protein [Stigonema ocellatum SAG 48.90 = DSM 106950]
MSNAKGSLMVNGIPLIEVYCTRPNCQYPINRISEECLSGEPIRQRFCTNCGMPLILERRFLPLNPLVPDEERGGFGRTFIAWDLHFSERPARVVKQLHPRVPPSQSQLEVIERMFKREGNVLERLSHPQIPRARAWAAVDTPPDLQDQSVRLSDNRQRFFYLVQDYIEGQNLAQELKQKGQFSEEEIIKILQQLLEILKYIHSQGVIHRDIKPSNIMYCQTDENFYLIDFGAVKQVVAGVPTEQSVVLGTPDYAPPEQLSGRAVSPSSDLYSLAATCVCLLTGRNLRELRHEDKWIWRQYARVNENLANILDCMLLPEPQHRFQSAADVITALFQPPSPHERPLSPPEHPTYPPTNVKKLSSQERLMRKLKRLVNNRVLPVGVLVLVGLAIALAIQQFFPTYSSLPEVSPTSFTRGEKSLFKQDIESNNPVCQEAEKKKIEGMQAFGTHQKFSEAKNNFQAAIALSKQAPRDQTSSTNCFVDPETQIFLNNAEANIKGNPLTIAVVVPVNGKSQFSKLAQQVLRGVAHVQDNLNHKDNGIQGRLLQVIIVTDNKNSETAKKVAMHLAKNHIPGDTNFKSEILGVVGHFTSDETLAAGEVYDSNQLVAVSPTSTAFRQSNTSSSSYKFNLSKYVFRTAPTDSVAADKLFKYLVQKNLVGGKGAVFFNHEESYSLSLKEAFEKNEQRFARGEFVTCDLFKYRVDECVKQVEGAKFLILALSTEEATEKGLFAIELMNGKLTLLGGDTLYSDDKLSPYFGDKARNMVIAVPTHVSVTAPWFQAESVKLWRTQSVGWRSATAYDATQVIVEGLKKQGNAPTRQGLYDVLNDPKFSAQGATGIVQFDELHDRKVNFENHQLGVLVNLCKSKNEKQYQFCLLEQQ